MKTALLLFFAAFSLCACAQHRTLTYYENDSLSLQLDLFLPEKTTGAAPVPLLLFVHGGGFATGSRQFGHPLCSALATEGIAAASISYSLYMKDKSFSCDGVLTEKIHAIRLAVSQLWQATAYLLEHGPALGIDTSKVFIAGSSAGGETVLHAAFWDRSLMSLYPGRLPDGFQYRGLISGAGAIMDLNLIRPDNALPMMVFHGSNDPVVPYGTAAHHFCSTDAPGWLMLFGSRSIYEHAIALGLSVDLTTFCGDGHERAGAFFNSDPQPVLRFLQAVLAGDVFQHHRIEGKGEGASLPCGSPIRP
ncbi:alpha/beta hydrolase [Phaeodactylibacter luteus]|uniref:Alpha/beta hydrolase n=1 Tax=Phaeodactylibacter luteus TaxID=1564516 RepID=A0A5C6RQF6_9BACT|nr:alpha/beta hydrolase fold domain-containing protein [Phaeodactylibacter luteus]TXB64473.1 alpha/beta hydrolase [Phaeodactylibacter luteus]